MGVESSTERQNVGELGSVQNAVGPDEEITSIDALTTEIEAVIDRTSNLHQHDYVVGEVSDYGVSQGDDVHFKLVHRKKGRKDTKDDRLHCIIYEDRRADITANIRDGQRVAVTGDLSFYAPRSRCSIEVKEVRSAEEDSSQPLFAALPASRHQVYFLAMVILIVLVIGGFLLL